jgi:hypothetical protein
VQPHRVERHLLEAHAGEGAQLDADGAHRLGEPHPRPGALRARPLGRGHRRRPEGGGVAGAEAAGHALHRARPQLGAARHREPARQLAQLGVELELDDGHRRHGAHVLRVQHVE